MFHSQRNALYNHCYNVVHCKVLYEPKDQKTQVGSCNNGITTGFADQKIFYFVEELAMQVIFSRINKNYSRFGFIFKSERSS